MQNTVIRLIAAGSVSMLLLGCNDTNSMGGSASPSPSPSTTPSPSPSTPSPSPSTPSPSPSTPSPSPSGSDNRTVGPDSSASQAADLSTPDNAAKFASFGVMSDAQSSSNQPKATNNCNVSGSSTTDTTNNGQNTKITYALCRERNDTLLTEQDGVINIASGGFTGSSVQSTITLGESGTSYSYDLLEPAASQMKSLQLGTVNFTTTLSGQQFTPTRADGQLRLTGAQINTRKTTRPRIDYRVGSDSTAYQVTIEDLDKTESRSTFSGPVAVSGVCGSGSATVSTPTPLRVNNSTGAITAGQITVQSSSGSATFTYNSDGTVTISAGGSSRTYTQQQLADLSSCPAFAS